MSENRITRRQFVRDGGAAAAAAIAKEKAGVEAKIKALMQQGCGIVCLHYATGEAEEGNHRLGHRQAGRRPGSGIHLTSLLVSSNPDRSCRVHGSLTGCGATTGRGFMTRFDDFNSRIPSVPVPWNACPLNEPSSSRPRGLPESGSGNRLC